MSKIKYLITFYNKEGKWFMATRKGLFQTAKYALKHVIYGHAYFFTIKKYTGNKR